MKNNKLLSICIPTYNRAFLLRNNLAILCPLLNIYPEVSIIVSNNCSTDDTAEVLSSFENIYKNFSVFTQKENVGADKNFETVLKISDAKYQWLLGDSHLVDEIGLRKILDILRNNSPNLLVINREMHFSFPSKKYTDSDLLLKELGWHITNIASLIISCELIAGTNFKKYYGTNLIQFGIVFEYLAFLNSVNVIFENDRILKSTDALLIQKHKGNSWFPKYAWSIFAKSWTDVVLSLPSNYTLSSKRECIVKHNKYTKIFSIRNIFLMRSTGDYNYSVYRENVEYIKFVIGRQRGLYFILSVYPNWLNPYRYRNQILNLIQFFRK